MSPAASDSKLSNIYGQPAVRRLLWTAWWALPSLLCLLLYWPGLMSWFAQDDFAWLGLRLGIYNFHDFLVTMFSPKAQGTIRPLSERGFFLLFEWLFGINALPFRIFVFLTQFANLMLLSWLALRLTRSRLAGFLAPVLWMVNGALSVPMSWTSSYNQILWAFFLLSSFCLWVLYVQTGSARYYAGQWVAFLLGFGALELNVVYPAIAAGYALITARKYLWRTVPMFAVSLSYVALHNAVAPKQSQGVYGIHYDAAMWRSFKQYLEWALGPGELELLGWQPAWFLEASYWALLTGILGYIALKSWKREWMPLLYAGWFILVLAPVLPLRDHVSGYYVVVPAIGLALLLSHAVADSLRAGWVPSAAALLLIALYSWSSASYTRAATVWQYRRSNGIRQLVGGIARARELHPRSVIALSGVSPDFFWGALANNPLRLLGIHDVYLTPESLDRLGRHPEIADIDDFTLPAAILRRSLLNGTATVYDASTYPIRSITQEYAKTFLAGSGSEYPDRVDPGNPLYAGFVGEGWYAPEPGYRWMSRYATVVLSAPNSASAHLYLSGYAPSQLIAEGVLSLQVRVDGQPADTVRLGGGDQSFKKEIPIRVSPDTRQKVAVSIECDRTFRPLNDARDLCIAVTHVAIR